MGILDEAANEVAKEASSQTPAAETFSVQDLAGTSETTQSAAPPAAGTFSAQDLGGKSLLDQVAAEDAQASSTVNQSKFAPYNAAAFGRYTTAENYEKWASTHPKTGPDAKPGEYEAWSGANTPGGYEETLLNSAKVTGEAGLAAGTALGVTAIPEVLPSVLIHTVEGVKALGAWAEAHPYKAFMLYQVAKELLPGAKKAMGLVKAAPIPE
jgi:hypothetical protein